MLSMTTLDHQRLQWLSRVRRDFHRYPELSFQETRTTDTICTILASLGIDPQRLPESPGAVALLNGGKPGPTIGLRADIDALPIQELNPAPYRSDYDNRMHACGHDANTAIMLGVARTLKQSGNMPDLSGNVKFLFQPAEERINGARAMIGQGVLENPRVDRVIAGHMAPDLDVGTIGVFKGHGYAAADLFTLTITGCGGHGGRPHETVDPILAGAHFVTCIQSIVARNVDPIEPAVISVGKFAAGDAGNVIPETAVLEGTIRTHSAAIRENVFSRLRDMADGLETSFRVRSRFVIEPETPCCNSDPDVSTFLYRTAVSILGEEHVVWLPPTMGSEDFAFFTLERPSSIIRIGCRNRKKDIVSPLHSPFFDIDERALEIGVQIFHRAVIDYLKPDPPALNNSSEEDGKRSAGKATETGEARANETGSNTQPDHRGPGF